MSSACTCVRKLAGVYPSPPVTEDGISDTWVGVTEENLHYCRLQLASDGTGLCAYGFLDDQPAVYAIRDWQLEDGRLKCNTQGLGGQTEPLLIWGAAHHEALLVRIRWGQGLPLRAVLRRESKWERRAKLAKEKMVAIQGNHPVAP